jgi:hypothetical protein
MMHLEARFVREVVALEDEDVDLLPLDNFFFGMALIGLTNFFILRLCHDS